MPRSIDFFSYLRRDAQFLAQFSRQRIPRRLAGLYLSARELPQ